MISSHSSIPTIYPVNNQENTTGQEDGDQQRTWWSVC